MGHSEKYWVSKDGQNMGPFTLDQIRDQMDSGLLSTADHACEVGLMNGQVSQLLIYLSEEAQSEVLSDGESEPRQGCSERFGKVSKYGTDASLRCLSLLAWLYFFGRRVTGTSSACR